jgi:3-hydroxypropanoate dehydrogenase
MTIAHDDDLDLLFLGARTHSAWLDRPVDDATLHRLWELTRMPPTSANSNPLRVVFVKSAAAKERLRPTLAPGNVDKTMTAPVTAIVAYDLEFAAKMGELFPARPEMGAGLAKMPEAARDRWVLLNGSLQAGYFILAARALGLDAGPMGGFDNAKVDAEFLAGTSWRSNILVNLGYGDASKLFPRNPRLAFETACRID